MTEYAHCPGQDCVAPVVVWPGDMINYCCHGCWTYTWAFMTSEDWTPDTVKEHSDQCLRRQIVREGVDLIDRETHVIAYATKPTTAT